MGYRYAYGFCLPTDQLEHALKKVAALADTKEGEQCLVRFPSGAQLELPFVACDDVVSTNVVELGSDAWFETSLWFPMDGTLQTFVDGCAQEKVIFPLRTDPNGMQVSIGLIDIFVHVGERYAAISCSARTSSMSDAFERSPNIRSAFRQVWCAVSGVAFFGHFSGAVESYEIIEPPIGTVEREANDPDAFVEEILLKFDKTGPSLL